MIFILTIIITQANPITTQAKAIIPTLYVITLHINIYTYYIQSILFTNYIYAYLFSYRIIFC